MADKDAHITIKDLTLAYGNYVVQQHLTFTNLGFIQVGSMGKRNHYKVLKSLNQKTQ